MQLHCDFLTIIHQIPFDDFFLEFVLWCLIK